MDLGADKGKCGSKALFFAEDRSVGSKSNPSSTLLITFTVMVLSLFSIIPYFSVAISALRTAASRQSRLAARFSECFYRGVSGQIKLPDINNTGTSALRLDLYFGRLPLATVIPKLERSRIIRGVNRWRRDKMVGFWRVNS